MQRVKSKAKCGGLATIWGLCPSPSVEPPLPALAASVLLAAAAAAAAAAATVNSLVSLCTHGTRARRIVVAAAAVQIGGTRRACSKYDAARATTREPVSTARVPGAR